MVIDLGFVRFAREEEGNWFANVPPFQGCMTEADTLPGAVYMIFEATCLWVSVAIEDWWKSR